MPLEMHLLLGCVQWEVFISADVEKYEKLWLCSMDVGAVCHQHDRNESLTYILLWVRTEVPLRIVSEFLLICMFY